MAEISSVASVNMIPTIAQTLRALNTPQLPNFNVGTPNADANASAASTSVPCGSASSGGSIDTCA